MSSFISSFRLYSLVISTLLVPVFSPVVCYGSTDGALPVDSQWGGKKIIILGDSISDKGRVGTDRCWWEYLEELLGLEAESYALNGSETDGVLSQAVRVYNENGQDFDGIIVFVGTNDFNSSLPVGEWYSVSEAEVNRNGETVSVLRRSPIMVGDTFKGRLNILADYLKTHFPEKQIVFMTPLHRGFATFGEYNVQPDESYANAGGLFIDDYVQAVKELANVWAFPVIDLNAISGLYPSNDSHVVYFHNKDTDMLHPNSKGHERLAKTVMYQLLALPCL